MIHYFKGDVFAGLEKSNKPTKILIHICNNKGGWGKGFVTALSNKWEQPETLYRECFKLKFCNCLGDVQICQIGSIYVINMVAQDGYRTQGNPHPLNYYALSNCLTKLQDWIKIAKLEAPIIFCPKIGTGLAGGDWNVIEKLLLKYLNEIDLNVYEL